MICSYIRSSLYNSYDYCQMQTFINYSLGWPSASNKKADLGTMAHKVMEGLSGLKKFLQDNPKRKYLLLEDDVLGKIKVHENKFFTEEYLDEISQLSFDKYSKIMKPHDWTKKDAKDVRYLVDIFTKHNDGQFDPRFRHIHHTEPHFDIPIEEDWAKYNFTVKGKKIEGQLSIKGTIDLVTLVNDDTIEVVDWKGLPLDTLLPTPEGFTTMGEIKKGDKVFDQYGQVCKVVGKSKVKVKDCFKITFDDHSEVTCDDEHLWKLSSGKTVPITKLRIGDRINVARALNCEPLEEKADLFKLGTDLVKNGSQFDRVPKKYFRASVQQRCSLLWGLGRDNKDGKFKEDIKHLLLTLGESPDKKRVRKIISIDKSITQKTQCISVDSPDNTYLCTENYIPTHNTGRRMNWATGEEKTFEKLNNDPQLLLYFYAISKLYPEYPNRIMSIFFCKDTNGKYDPKPFSMCFDKSDEERFLGMLKKQYLSIVNNKNPKLLDPQRKNFRCKMCHYKKTEWKDSGKCMCAFVKDHLDKNGIDKTTDELMMPGFDIGHYESPG